MGLGPLGPSWGLSAELLGVIWVLGEEGMGWGGGRARRSAGGMGKGHGWERAKRSGVGLEAGEETGVGAGRACGLLGMPPLRAFVCLPSGVAPGPL